MLRERALPHSAAFIEPCLPRPAKRPPAGRGWIHEIKHDGFRIMAQHTGGRVRLLTRKGTNFSNRFPQIVAAVTLLPVRSCLLYSQVNGTGIVLICNHLSSTGAGSGSPSIDSGFRCGDFFVKFGAIGPLPVIEARIFSRQYLELLGEADRKNVTTDYKFADSQYARIVNAQHRGQA